MKLKLPVLIAAFGCMLGCNDGDEFDNPPINHLSLYWQHEIFGEEGRRLQFEFFDEKTYDNTYELVFDYSITGQSITIQLRKIIDNGACPYFPSILPGGCVIGCSPHGRFFIPEDELAEGTYSIRLVAPRFEESATLTITKDKIELNIPANDHFSSQIAEVFPLPKNLLFGSINFSGNDNETAANELLAELIGLGLTKVTRQEYPYHSFSIDDDGNPMESFWEPANYSISFGYEMNVSFSEVLE